MKSIIMVPISDYVSLRMEVDRLMELLDELTERLAKVNVQQGVSSPLEKGIMICSGGKGRYIKVSDIVMIKAESNYSTVYLTSGESLFTSRTVKYWTEKCNVSFLFRVHKSYLINGRMIESFEPSKGKIFLKGGFIASYSDQGRKLLT